MNRFYKNFNVIIEMGRQTVSSSETILKALEIYRNLVLFIEHNHPNKNINKIMTDHDVYAACLVLGGEYTNFIIDKNLILKSSLKFKKRYLQIKNLNQQFI
jgi:hypothetical protein